MQTVPRRTHGPADPIQGWRGRVRGFTLLEMSVVLIIIAVVVGASMTMGNKWIEAERYRTTNRNFDVIEKALWTYLKANRRLPCPGRLHIAFSDATNGYGGEGDPPGNCASGTNSASMASGNVVAGALPADTLGLPRSMMTDGWGRRIVYYVDVRMTGNDAAETYPYDESVSIGAMRVISRLATGAYTERTSAAKPALYALISHGPNGHGAFMSNGTQNFSGSTDAGEWDNCSCNATVTSVAWTTNPSPAGFAAPALSVLVASSPFETFDDIVRYKRRSQLYDKP